MSQKGKGKKKGKKGGNDDPNQAIDELSKLEVHVSALHRRWIEQTERADRAQAAENDIKDRVFQMEQDFKAEQDNADMTRQYKQMQDELLGNVNELKQTVIDRDEEIQQRDHQISEMVKSYEYQLQQKDDEITELQRQIEDMSVEFAKMLQDTLDKMQERIDNVQWENDSDPQLIKNFKDLIGMGQN